MINILVTGSNGQLASSIKGLATKYDNLNFIYTDYQELDITDYQKLRIFFYQSEGIDYCINCAAYTAVDKAEEEEKLTDEINSIGAGNLAQVCSESNTTLIHISTDFVFDGENNRPYDEEDTTNPLNVYGKTKLDGEIKISNSSSKYFIIRTSWLYSEHQNNFMKTMLELAKNRKELSIISDQIGTPTYALDLATAILNIIISKNKDYGTYHYSNEGVASWYDFAKAIFEINNVKVTLNPIKTEAYPTPAKRPHYSVLDKTKIKSKLKLDIPYWRDSLITALKRHNESRHSSYSN